MEVQFSTFKAQLNGDNPEEIVRLNSPSGYDVDTGVLVELNLGIAEAVVKEEKSKDSILSIKVMVSLAMMLYLSLVKTKARL